MHPVAFHLHVKPISQKDMGLIGLSRAKKPGERDWSPSEDAIAIFLLSGCEMPIKLLSKYLCLYPLVLAVVSLVSGVKLLCTGSSDYY